jgi:hypothetical protein
MVTEEDHTHAPETGVSLPAPTAWPFVLAFGLTLMAAGLVTDKTISVLGVFLVVAGCIGWFRQVLPQEKHEMAVLEPFVFQAQTTRTKVARIQVAEGHRTYMPVETPSVVAGINGGLAGGVAMAVLAVLYGVVRFHSPWYPINLLAGAAIPGWENYTTAQLTAFHLDGFLLASVVHVVTSVLVGLLYGAILPIFPRRPVLVGGFVAPLLWTSLLWSSINVVNPLMDRRIAWGWFVVTQVAFGLVAGFVVGLHTNIRTRQHLSFAARVGLEVPGLMEENMDENTDRGGKE